jgi:hypothetical protein
MMAPENAVFSAARQRSSVALRAPFGATSVVMQAVLSKYMMALTIFRWSTVRRCLPCLAGGISGAIKAHSASVRLLG